MGLGDYFDSWFVFLNLTFVCFLVTDTLPSIGAARGTLGTHTLRNPKTGAIIPTWHEIDTSKVSKDPYGSYQN